MKNRVVSLLLSLIIIILSIPYVSAQDRYLTRGEVVEMLLKAADDYNPGVQKTDIIKRCQFFHINNDWDNEYFNHNLYVKL